VTSSAQSKNYRDSTNFIVNPKYSSVSIISVEPTDQQGNTINSFSKGKIGYVKVVLLAESDTPSLVTVNLFDSEITSLGIGSFKTTLSPGQSEMVISFFIPDFSVTGSADIYADAFSDWPSKGGMPLAGEKSTMVTIR